MPMESATLPDDVDALKRIIGAMARDAVAARQDREASIPACSFKRAGFGQSSEKVERTVVVTRSHRKTHLPSNRLFERKRQGDRTWRG
jgi:hypothetical protein